MTNRLAIWFLVLLLSAVMLDYGLNGAGHLLFLGKKLFDLLDWLAFWR